jgi:alkylation response protein AidB-like acyl-CoA dehydrogenase
MDFTLDEEQHELARSVRAVLAHDCPIATVRAIVESGSGPSDLWGKMTSLGWPAVPIPQDLGGLGLGWVELGLVLEEMGRALCPGPYTPTVTQLGAVIDAVAVGAQRESLLTNVASGLLTGTLALAEATGSWELADVSLRATRAGASWSLSGTKRFVLGATETKLLAVVAHVEENGAEIGDGLGVFLVPCDMAEVEADRGIDASRPTATVRFDELKIGAEGVLGSAGACRAGLQRAIDQAALAMAVETVGSCQAMFDLTLSYAKQRVQFGRPIGAFQAVQHKLADMLVVIEKARAVCYYALMAMDEGDRRAGVAASMAKVASDDCQRLVGKESVQIHGAMGYTWEYDLHLYLKRAAATAALFGNGAAHRRRIAATLAAARA